MSAPVVAKAPAGPQYGGQVVAPADANSDLKAAIADLKSTLGRMTVEAASAAALPTINLVRTSSPQAPADAVEKLTGKGREPFVIRSAGDNKVWIIANLDEGLSHGIYYYLEQLGARFYLPTDKWTIVPQHTDISLKIDKLVAPVFKMRTVFGTGGFGGKLPSDPEGQAPTAWDNWKRRLRFGGEFSMAGHSGEAFNTENKEILLKNPEYLAKVDGKHVPWSVGARLNTANPDAVKLYVDWSLARYRRLLKLRAGSPATFAVSVDPADGSGPYCNSDECKQIGNGSPSDQAFYFANETAKALRKEFPNAYASLYAYSAHAAVPSIPLEPNVYVAVIPYAFQRTGMTAEEMIAAWGKKVPRMSLYTYWSIPDWAYDEPTFNYLKTPAENLRYWNANGVEGYMLESTNSAGAIGLAWYIASKLSWDLNADPRAIAEEFYQKAFGAAAAPMKRMMERWATGFTPNSQELATSYRDLQEALKLSANDAGAQARVLDYGRYVRYLQLRFEMEQTKNKTPEREAAAEEVIRYALAIGPSTMITSFRIYQLVERYNIADWLKHRNETYRIPNRRNEAGPGWAGVTPVSDEDVTKFIAEGAARYQPLDFQIRNFSGELVPLRVARPAAPGGFSPAMALEAGTGIDVFIPADTKTMAIKASASATLPLRIVVTGENNAKIFEQTVAPGATTELSVPIARPGQYQIVTGGPGENYSLQMPSGIPMSLNRWSSRKVTTPIYFYVPRGVKNLAVVTSAGKAAVPVVLDSGGKRVASAQQADDGKLLLFPVAAGQDGKVWSINQVMKPRGFDFQLLNAPNTFSLSPDSLLVPEDALQ